MRNGSDFEEQLDQALSDMRNDGTLQLIHDRWWRSVCPHSSTGTWGGSSKAVVPVNLYRMSFVFLLFAAGILVGMIIMCIENLCYARRRKRKLTQR